MPLSLPTIPPGAQVNIDQAKSVLPGEYIFSITDAYGDVVLDTVNLIYPSIPVSASYSFPCGSSDMHVNISGF